VGCPVLPIHQIEKQPHLTLLRRRGRGKSVWHPVKSKREKIPHYGTRPSGEVERGSDLYYIKKEKGREASYRAKKGA